MMRALTRCVGFLALALSIAACSSGARSTLPSIAGSAENNPQASPAAAGFNPRSNVAGLQKTTLENTRNARLDATVQHAALQASGRTTQSSAHAGDIEQVGVFVNPGGVGTYNSIYARQSAYSVSQIQISYPTASTDTSAIYESLLPPNGACLGNFATWINAGSGTQGVFAVYNYCGATPGIVFETPIDDAFLAKYTQPYADGIPMYATEIFTTDLTPSPNSNWYSIIYNVQTGLYELLAQATGVNLSTTGFALWTSELQPQPCPSIPTMGAEYVEMWNNQTNRFDLLAPSLDGTTSQISPPAPNYGCFNKDATGRASYSFTVLNANYHYVISPQFRSVSVDEYAIPPELKPLDLTVLSGNAWVVEGSEIARVAKDGTVTEYPLPSPGNRCFNGIVSGGSANVVAASAGSIWASTSGCTTVTQVMTNGQVGPTYPLYCFFISHPQCQNPVSDITGPDGAIWYTIGLANGIEGEQGSIERFDTTTGTYTAYDPLLNLPPSCHPPSPPCLTGGIASGPDGALWFTVNAASTLPSDVIGRLSLTGQDTYYPLPSGDRAFSIVAGPDGALWLTIGSNDGEPAIGRLTTSGSLQTFSLPAGALNGASVRGIATGADGALWFTEPGINKIGRITTSGKLSQIDIPTASSGASAIVSDGDRRLWFIERSANKVGKIHY